MRIARFIFTLIVALTFLQANAHVMSKPTSSAEVAAQPACVCSGCCAPCDAARKGVEICLLSAACGFVCINVLAADCAEGLAAPSVGKRLTLPANDDVFSQEGSSPFRPPPTRPLADDSLATRKPGACAESCSAMPARWLERIDGRQVNRRLSHEMQTYARGSRSGDQHSGVRKHGSRRRNDFGQEILAERSQLLTEV